MLLQKTTRDYSKAPKANPIDTDASVSGLVQIVFYSMQDSPEPSVALEMHCRKDSIHSVLRVLFLLICSS